MERYYRLHQRPDDFARLEPEPLADQSSPAPCGLTQRKCAGCVKLASRGGIWLRADNLEIHLGVEADFRPARKAHPGILVGDLDGLAARLAGRGAAVDWDDSFPGFRRFYTFDTWGNRLEFMSPIVTGSPDQLPGGNSPGASERCTQNSLPSGSRITTQERSP